MNRPEPGLPLLRAILKKIDRYPKKWDQRHLAIRESCGTAMCVAGHAAVMRGHKLKFGPDGLAWVTVDLDQIWNVAQDELRLNHNEARDLFDELNSREVIQQIAEGIAFARGETL